MKSSWWAALAIALFAAGCAGPRPTSDVDKARNVAILMTNMMPVGAKRVYDAPYNLVWRAALDAAQQGDLEILSADRSRGYISVRSGARVDTTGETLGVSVRSLGPAGTEVGAVSRQSGPVGAAFKNWEAEILRGISSGLARDDSGVGGTGTQVYIQNHIDRESTTFIPESRARTTTTLVPENRLEKLREIERRVAELRARQREREAALGPEGDEDRREEIRAEIDRLREELRFQEERLADLERNRP